MNVRHFLTVTAIGIAALFQAGAAHAAPCDAVVGDDARIFADTQGVSAAAAALRTRTGGIVRVRTTNTLGGYANLAPYTQYVVEQCPQWRATANATNSLLVLVLYRDPATAKGRVEMWAGNDVKAKLTGSAWDAIKKQQIGPLFNAGDHAGAAVAGLNGIRSAISAVPTAPIQQIPQAQQVPAPPVQQTTPAVPGPQAPPYATPTPPQVPTVPQSSGGGMGLIIVLVLLVLAGGGAAWYFVSQSKARRAAAQQEAKNMATSCAGELESFSATKLTVLTAQVTKASSGCSAADATALSQLLSTLKSGVSEVEQHIGRLAQNSNPDDDGKTAEQYGSIKTAYANVLSQLTVLKATQTKITNRIAELAAQSAQAKPTIDALEAKMTAAAAAIAEAEEAGFMTETLTTDLEAAVALQETATTELSEGRGAAAKSTADSAAGKAAKVVSDATGLATRAANIAARVDALTADVDLAKEQIETGKTEYAYIEANFVASSTETLTGNGGRATQNVVAAQAAVKKAGELADMKTQDWKGAEDLLDSASGLLNEARSQLRSITAMKQSLDTAKKTASDVLTSAQDDIRTAETFIAHHAEDIEDKLEGTLLQRLRAATTKLPAQSVLAQAKPDYLAIIAAAQAATKVSSEVLSNAKKDQENTQRLRRVARTAIETAVGRISAAKEYVEDHYTLFGDRYADSLRAADRLLESARSHTDPSKAAQSAESAATTAGEVLEKAKGLVRDEQNRRDRLRKQQAQRNNGGTVHHHHHGNGGGDSFLGGVIAGAVLNEVLSDDHRGGRGGGGIMGGDDNLSSRFEQQQDAGGGIMGGNDALSDSPSPTFGGSDEL